MLGKQWLNRYASIEMRGSAIARSQNRQRKLDGIVRWYFNTVMESLPLMLQAALLLLGCALSLYLWEISIIVASVVIGVTSFGLLFYLFILVVGTAWESCPYQTPGSRFFRYLGPKLSSSATSAFRKSEVIGTFTRIAMWHSPWWSGANIAPFLKDFVNEIPLALAKDARRLGRAVIQPLGVTLATAYRLRLRGTPPAPGQGMNHQSTVSGLRCISWTLRTSLDKPVHLSTLEHLVTIAEFTDFDSTLIIDCFNIFVGCISVRHGKVVIVGGMEQLAIVSARCLFQTFRHLSTTRPTSSILADIRRRYNRIFLFHSDFRGLPLCYTMTKIHGLVNQDLIRLHVWWTDYRPSDQELIPFARHMVDAAQAEYQQTQNKRVPCWILRFALHFLSLDPPSLASVIADCLTIIAIALDHDPSGVLISNERYIRSVLWVPTVLTKVQCTSRATVKHHHSEARDHGWGPGYRSNLPVQAQGH